MVVETACGRSMMHASGDGKSKGKSKSFKSSKGSYQGDSSKTGLSGLENPKSRDKSRNTGICASVSNDNSWFDDGWSFDEWNDDWSSVGWLEGLEETYDNPARSLCLGSPDLGAASSPRR